MNKTELFTKLFEYSIELGCKMDISIYNKSGANYISIKLSKWHKQVKKIFLVDDLKNCGSELKVKEACNMRLEGKEYLMQDGDICYFRFNV